MSLEERLVQTQQLATDISNLIIKVNNQYEEILKSDVSVGDFAESFINLRACYEKINAARKDLYKLQEHVSNTLMPEMFDKNKIGSSFNTKSGFRVTISSRLSVTMSGDEEKAMDWLRSNGLGNIIKPTVNASSLSSAVKELIEVKNMEPPTDLFSVKPSPFTSITKTK